MYKLFQNKYILFLIVICVFCIFIKFCKKIPEMMTNDDEIPLPLVEEESKENTHVELKSLLTKHLEDHKQLIIEPIVEKKQQKSNIIPEPTNVESTKKSKLIEAPIKDETNLKISGIKQQNKSFIVSDVKMT